MCSDTLAPQDAFFFPQDRADHLLHSFPTRRSSDLPFRRRRGGVRDAERPPPPRVCVPRLKPRLGISPLDRKSTSLNSSHITISYAVFCLKKKRISRSGVEGS